MYRLISYIPFISRSYNIHISLALKCGPLPWPGWCFRRSTMPWKLPWALMTRPTWPVKPNGYLWVQPDWAATGFVKLHLWLWGRFVNLTSSTSLSFCVWSGFCDFGWLIWSIHRALYGSTCCNWIYWRSKALPCKKPADTRKEFSERRNLPGPWWFDCSKRLTRVGVVISTRDHNSLKYVETKHPTSARPCFLVKTWHLAASSVHPTCRCWGQLCLDHVDGKDWAFWGSIMIHPFSVMILPWMGSWHVLTTLLASIGSGIPGCSWNKRGFFGISSLRDPCHPCPKHSCWIVLAGGSRYFLCETWVDLNWLTHSFSFRWLNVTNYNNRPALPVFRMCVASTASLGVKHPNLIQFVG